MIDEQRKKHERTARQAVTKATINRDAARGKLLRHREKLARRRTRNRRQSEPRGDDATGGTENPTAHSTLPPGKSNAENAARRSHSTVPATPKYSNVPARERLYGQRLHHKTDEGNDTNPNTPAVDQFGSDTKGDESTNE